MDVKQLEEFEEGAFIWRKSDGVRGSIADIVEDHGIWKIIVGWEEGDAQLLAPGEARKICTLDKPKGP